MPPRIPPTVQDHPQSTVPATEARTSIAQGMGEDPDRVAKREILQRELALRPKE